MFNNFQRNLKHKCKRFQVCPGACLSKVFISPNHIPERVKVKLVLRSHRSCSIHDEFGSFILIIQMRKYYNDIK